MEPLRWLFEIRDAMTSPLRNMTRALRDARGGLREVDASLEPVETGFTGLLMKGARVAKSIMGITFAVVALGRAAMFLGGLGFFKEIPKVFAAFKAGGIRGGFAEGGAALGRMGDTFLDRIGLARSSAGQLGNRLAEAFRNMRPAAVRALKIGAGLAVAGLAAYGLFKGLQSVLSVSLRISTAIADWTRRFGEAVLQARLMRERTTFGLTLLTGSRGAASAVMEEARELSEFLGTDLHETVAGIQDLMVRGFSQRASTSIFQAMADLRAISPRPVDTSRILLAIGQIQQAGRLQGDELNQLAESGLPLDAIRRRMAANLNTTVSELRSLQSAGRISSDVAIRSIMEGISDVTGGPLGEAGREFSFTLPGMLDRLRQTPTRVFDAIAARSDGAFGRVNEMLRELLGLLDTNSAGFQRIIEVGVAGFDMLVEGLRTAWEFGRVFFEGLAEGFGADPGATGADALSEVREALVSLRSNPEALRSIRMIGEAFAAAAITAGVLLRAIAPIVIAFHAAYYQGAATVARISAKFVEMQINAFSWGRDMIAGLVSGIQSGLEMLRSAVATVANTVTGGIAGALEIHSPSRVMMELGEMTGAGFVAGLTASMPELGGVAAPAPELGPGASAAAAAAGGAGGMQVNLNIEVSVQGGDPNAGEAIADQIRAAVVAMFAQLEVEGGVG